MLCLLGSGLALYLQIYTLNPNAIFFILIFFYFAYQIQLLPTPIAWLHSSFLILLPYLTLVWQTPPATTSEYLPSLHYSLTPILGLITLIYLLTVNYKQLYRYTLNPTTLIAALGLSGLLWASTNFTLDNWWALNDISETTLLLTLSVLLTQKHLNPNFSQQNFWAPLTLLLLLYYYLSTHNFAADSVLHTAPNWKLYSGLLFLWVLTPPKFITQLHLPTQPIIRLSWPRSYAYLNFIYLLTLSYIILFTPTLTTFSTTYNSYIGPQILSSLILLYFINTQPAKFNNYFYLYLNPLTWPLTLWRTFGLYSTTGATTPHYYYFFIYLLLIYSTTSITGPLLENIVHPKTTLLLPTILI